MQRKAVMEEMRINIATIHTENNKMSNKCFPLSNYFKCKRIKFPNQKTD